MSSDGCDEEAHSSDSGNRKKHKKSKKKSSKRAVEDAIEKKLKEKKKKEKAAAAAEDALEAKIRAKQMAAEREGGSEDEGSEEEKVEEGISNDHANTDDSQYSRSKSGSSAKSSKSKKSAAKSGATTAAAAADAALPLFTTGGGDVRNRPAPGTELDPLRAQQEAEEEKRKNAKQVNRRYADVHETGQWGGLSKWEKYGLCFLALAAVGAAVGLGIKFASDARTDAPTKRPTTSPTGAPSLSPTPAPTVGDYRETSGLEAMKKASPKLALRVDAPDELAGASADPNSTPQEIAAEFVLFEDALQIGARNATFLERYALAVFYYGNGGCAGDWIDDTNWMNPKLHHCEWFGVVCDLTLRVTELSMGSNYVTGKMPVEMSLMEMMSTLDLSNNRMEGTVPVEALNISSLFTLRLTNNDFSGDFPFDTLLGGAPLLNTLWIQENSKLSGEITEAYCGLYSVTLDCDNFTPQPTYISDGSMTTFEAQCLEETGSKPNEYTCNAETGTPITKPPSPTPTNVCGTPVQS